MKRIIMLAIVALMVCHGAVYGLPGAPEKDNMSLKAGPTEPGEGLSLAWVESLVYPKVVKDEKMISLSVRTTSQVKNVKVVFDFDPKGTELMTKDKMNWYGVCRVPANLAEGIHVARYQISDRRGSIQRTVDFYVEKQKDVKVAKASVSRGEAVQNTSWPLTTTASCQVYSGNGSLNVKQGQILTGISKMMWYRVVLDGGKEGWISAANVKDPSEDYCQQGAEAYRTKKYKIAAMFYRSALDMNPEYVNGYVGLAKTLQAQNNLYDSASAIKKALRLDDRNIEARQVADTISQKLVALGHRKFRGKNYSAAVAAYRSAQELTPLTTTACVELGKSLNQLGLEAEARSAWREGLGSDPDNSELRALLGEKELQVAALSVKAGKKQINASAMLADDSILIIKKQSTSKGTKIEAAITSVVAMTKSLGTPIVEKGWQVKRKGEKFLVTYLCEQSGGALESFDWLVDVDTRQVIPQNDNARILMSRW